jgi:predicted DNA binding CopG/RHH family protein
MMNSAHENNEVDTCRWESGELGLSQEHAVACSQEHEAAVDEALAMQLISIRLPKRLIDDLKFIAEREGLGYQPLVRRVLMRFASSEFKNIAMETLVSDSYAADGSNCEEESVLKVANG